MPDDDPTNPARVFAANLKSIRTHLGLTQEAFAQLMSQRGHSWHQATVYKVENGTRQIELSEAQAAAHILDMSIDRMITGTSDVTTANLLRELLTRLLAEESRRRDAEANYRMLVEDLREAVGRMPAGTRPLLTNEEVDEIERRLGAGDEPET